MIENVIVVFVMFVIGVSAVANAVEKSRRSDEL